MQAKQQQKTHTNIRAKKNTKQKCDNNTTQMKQTCKTRQHETSERTTHNKNRCNKATLKRALIKLNIFLIYLIDYKYKV